MMTMALSTSIPKARVSENNTTMFNVSLPDIAEQFRLLPSRVSWVVSGYVIIFAISSVTYGRLADTYSIKTLVTIGLVLFKMFRTIVRNSELKHEHVSKRLVIQASIRILLPPVFAGIGMAVAYFNKTATYFLYIFPFVFNTIPGGLNLLEKIFLRKKLDVILWERQMMLRK